MPLESLKKLSLNELITRLHESIGSFSRNISKLTERNRELTLVDIIELRNHVKKKLEAHEESAENERLLKLIELFKDDKNALELARIDVDEWIDFLDAIKFHLEQSKGALSKEEQEEIRDIEKLREDITRLQAVLRKG
ncbi:MAG: hypothetical protein LVQ95_03815 [Candidatus Micrarchaeales archaeon]|nr:hypothetical protein [Candidatus Micrarchaeales archaeon]